LERFTKEERQRRLEVFKQVLNTQDGKKLMAELETLWDAQWLRGDSEAETNYNVGLRDAFKYLQALQNGDMING